jgi:hypothetical protein
MNFLSRVVRFLFWVLVLSWGLKLLRQLVAWMTRRAAPAPPRQGARAGVDVAGTSEAVGLARRLVRDPICGVHVAEVLAIPLRENTATLHFCSVTCRDEYVRRQGAKGEIGDDKIAATG